MSWVTERPNLRPKTVQLYEGLVRLHLVPLLGKLAVADIKEGAVRHWRKSLRWPDPPQPVPDRGCRTRTFARAASADDCPGLRAR